MVSVNIELLIFVCENRNENKMEICQDVMYLWFNKGLFSGPI